MFTGRRSTLLLALLACFQLVLGPALRPVGCGMSAGGGGRAAGCCAAAAVPDAGVAAPQDLRAPGACCCDAGTDADPDGGADPADRGDPRGGCGCVHAPQPSAPVGDPDAREAPAPTAAIVPRAERIVAVGPPAGAPCEARAGPPGRAGPALHVLHCVFLI